MSGAVWGVTPSRGRYRSAGRAAGGRWCTLHGVRIAELVLSYVKTVEWPAVVVVLAVLFRRSVRAILGRITEVSGGGLSAKFEQQAEGIAARADAAVDMAGATVWPAESAARNPYTPRAPAPSGPGAPEPPPPAPSWESSGPSSDGSSRSSPGAVAPPAYPEPPVVEAPSPARVWSGPWSRRVRQADPDFYNRHQREMAERFRPVRRLVAQEPERAVRAAWQGLVRTLEEVAAVQGLPRVRRLNEILDHLGAVGLSEEYRATVRELEEMHEEVERGAPVTPNAAAAYLRAGRTLATALAPGRVIPLDEPPA